MREGRFLTIAEQVAEHLREELAQGRWSGVIPGKHQLAKELEINNKTVEAALWQLEKEGLLLGQGAGKRRRIAPQAQAAGQRALRVALLLNEPADLRLDYLVGLQHELMEAGHQVLHPPKSLTELRMDVKRIRRMVAKTEADAWVVFAGSGEVLNGFLADGIPAFALFGRRRGLPIAGVGPDKPPAMAAAARALIGLGHRRIVLMVRPRRRLPQPGAPEQAFLDELARHGIEPGPYYLPAWDEHIRGFQERLELMFRQQPPTALIVDEVPLFNAAYHFVARLRLRVPEEVSLVCTDESPDFEWCQPSVAHIRWDKKPVVRRILKWVENVAAGKQDRRQTLTPAQFVPGGTIGPAREG